MASARQLNQHSYAYPLSLRLRSIEHDAAFVRSVAARLGLPVVANERCGSWYVPPDVKAGSAYFKSTDGHVNQWAFSLRRLNLHVLGLCGAKSGCIVVDSCRHGKNTSDALAKTVPIWCCVMNQLLFQSHPHEHGLHLHPSHVGDEEASRIRDRVESFLANAKALDLDLPFQLQKPLKPVWIGQGSDDAIATPSDADHVPIYLCMASALEQSDDYLQGAGDDAENWSRGMTPEVFWSSLDKLKGRDEDELADLIDDLVILSQSAASKNTHTTITPFSILSVGSITELLTSSVEGISLFVVCAPSMSQEMIEKLGKRALFFKCRPGKLGSRDLRNQLPLLMEGMRDIRSRKAIRVACEPDEDFAVGVALAIICRFGTDDGFILGRPTDRPIDKAFIKRSLAIITSAAPNTSLSRATLNSVHGYLMPPPGENVVPRKRKAD